MNAEVYEIPRGYGMTLGNDLRYARRFGTIAWWVTDPDGRHRRVMRRLCAVKHRYWSSSSRPGVVHIAQPDGLIQWTTGIEPELIPVFWCQTQLARPVPSERGEGRFCSTCLKSVPDAATVLRAWYATVTP